VVPPSRGGIAAAPPRVTPSGVPAPGTPGTLEGRIPARGSKDEGGSIDRNTGGQTPVPGNQPVSTPQITPPNNERVTPSWRNRVEHPAPSAPAQRPSIDRTPPPPADRNATPPPRGESWRGRTTGRRDVQPPPPSVERYAPIDRGSDIPRRIIDRIGGARIYTEPAPSAPRERTSSPPPARER